LVLSAASTGGGAIGDANAPRCQGARRSGLCASLATREQHPKQSISATESGTFHGALEHRQLLTEYEILERDRSVSIADPHEGSEHEDERSQHELSCPAINHRINRARRSGCGEPHLAASTTALGGASDTLRPYCPERSRPATRPGDVVAENPTEVLATAHWPALAQPLRTVDQLVTEPLVFPLCPITACFNDRVLARLCANRTYSSHRQATKAD
jgi:hypothetical protein